MCYCNCKSRFIQSAWNDSERWGRGRDVLVCIGTQNALGLRLHIAYFAEEVVLGQPTAQYSEDFYLSSTWYSEMTIIVHVPSSTYLLLTKTHISPIALRNSAMSHSISYVKMFSISSSPSKSPSTSCRLVVLVLPPNVES